VDAHGIKSVWTSQEPHPLRKAGERQTCIGSTRIWLPSGVKVNVHEKLLGSWRPFYCQTYAHKTQWTDTDPSR
jgi:hypothetical protein